MSHPDYENQNASAEESIEPEDEIRDLRNQLTAAEAREKMTKAELGVQQRNVKAWKERCLDARRFGHRAEANLIRYAEKHGWEKFHAQYEATNRAEAAEAVLQQLVNILDRENKPNISNQGQGLDGYSMLANFRAIAEKAREHLEGLAECKEASCEPTS